MPRTFDCPKCGAPVKYDQAAAAAGHPQTLRCDYCHSSLIAPDELRGHQARVVPIRINLGLSSNRHFSKFLWVILAIPILAMLVGVLAMAGVLAPVIYSVSRAVNEPSSPTRTNSREASNSFANVLLKFGSEGIGPGMFTDARSIGVDGAGRIYVGEYTGGRIQVFDSAGNFQTQWSFGDRKTLLRGLAVNRKGTVYVAHGGDIHLYRGETGERLGQLAYEKSGFDDVSAAADGGLATAWHRNRDDLVRFDASGKVAKTVPAAISSASGDSELSMRVAIDGAGNIFALGRFNNAVFKFSPDGKFVNRFGGSGDQPGQLRAPHSIAVDGWGRVYVGDIKGVQVFDGNGRYLTTFKPDGPAFGMVFNDKNELFVIARDKVIKYAVQGQ